MTTHNIPTISVGDLRRHLEPFGDDWEVSFSGLKFFRTKARGPKLVQIEFEQVVYLDEQGHVVVENP